MPKCVGCGERLLPGERAFCEKCLLEHISHKKRDCSACGKSLPRCTCTNDYLKSHYVKKLIKVFRYLIRDDREIISNKAVYSLKRDNRRDVIGFLADELTDSIKANININESFVITSVPRRSVSIRKYGYDHALLLAKAIAKKLELPYISLLRSTAEEAQKSMIGEERKRNATFEYTRRMHSVKGKRVILVDDIVTTGASMGACATLIKGLGAKEIIGATLAIAFKDKPVFPPQFK